jgi:hypothetical protein
LLALEASLARPLWRPQGDADQAGLAVDDDAAWTPARERHSRSRRSRERQRRISRSKSRSEQKSYQWH